MSIDVINTLPEDEWRSFVWQHQRGNIFHTPEMFQVFARTKGHQPELWAAANNKRILAMFIPTKISLLNGFLRRLTMRAVSYGSVLCQPDQEGREALSQLLSVYADSQNEKPLFTELRNISSLDSVQAVLQDRGFRYENHVNYLIDLDLPPDIVFQNIGARTRKNIRHALNQGKVKIEVVKERDKIPACYDLLRKTYQAARVPLADSSLFEAAYDVLSPKGMVRFTLAYIDQKPVGVSVDLTYNRVIYGWYGGVDREYRSHVPNEVLMWNILKWGAENGYRVYDFGGAGDPDAEYGVRDFKAKFGGDLVSFGRNICVHSPILLGMSKWGYKILRRFMYG